MVDSTVDHRLVVVGLEEWRVQCVWVVVLGVLEEVDILMDVGSFEGVGRACSCHLHDPVLFLFHVHVHVPLVLLGMW